MDETRTLKTDPITQKVRLEVVNMEPVKVVYREDRLTKRKQYLEIMIAKFQEELVGVDNKLNQINNAKSVGK